MLRLYGELDEVACDKPLLPAEEPELELEFLSVVLLVVDEDDEEPLPEPKPGRQRGWGAAVAEVPP